MSMLDSFFNKGFKGGKCKTLLKLTIPRIKLLRNRREVQIKQMRRDIAKLLETGQEATARIRVEHIIREENMMAAQEILELFCELISVRLPIIETQRECPLDLKEAISSVCFAAPRCADLPELLQAQMLFGQKYGKEFVSAATELMPDCGVNRQLIELLSIRAPSPEKKLKLLKEIAEEHEVDWDPTASETEFLKPHEDLLNGPTQFVSGSKLPLPEEKHDDSLNSASYHAQSEGNDSDSGLDSLDFPEVPKVSLRPTANTASAPEVVPPPPVPAVLHPNIDHSSSSYFSPSENEPQIPHLKHEDVIVDDKAAVKDVTPNVVIGAKEEKQYIPFVSPPSQTSTTFVRQSSSPPSISRTKSEANVDFQDVLAAAQAAAETAERAAAAARSAATITHARISELTKKNTDQFPEIGENPFHADDSDQSAALEKQHFKHQDSFDDTNGATNQHDSKQYHEDSRVSELPDIPSFDRLRVEHDSLPSDYVHERGSIHHQPQRLPSMDDESYFSYPNLFGKQNSNLESSAQTVSDNSSSTHEH